MPNRGQTQDPGPRGRKSGTFSPDDDETVQGGDNERQPTEQQARRNTRDLPTDEGADIESDDDAGTEDDDDEEVTGISQ